MTARVHTLPSPLGRRLGRGPVVGLLGAGAAALAAALAVILGPGALAVPFGVGALVLLARYPLALLVVFLHIGLFKDQPIVESIPADATVILGGLLVLVCAHRTLERRALKPPLALVLPVLLIAIMLLVSLTWTPVPGYGTSKALRFATLTLLAVLAPFCLIEKRRDLIQFLTFFAVAAVLAAVAAVALGSTNAVGPVDSEGRLVFGGASNSIFLSRFLLTGALILLLASLLGMVSRHRLLLAGVAGGLVAVSASIGSRGPIVGLLLAVVITLLAIILREPRRILPVLVVVAGCLALLPFISLPETSAQRLQKVAQNPVGSLDEDLRSRLYDKAVELTGDYPLRGIGSGGFFLYSYVLADREERFPHNVFLEASSELGVIPALALAISIALLLAALYRRAWQAGKGLDRNLTYLVGAILLLNLFASQFSGDFNDNRVLWAALGLGWLVATYGVEPRPRTDP